MKLQGEKGEREESGETAVGEGLVWLGKDDTGRGKGEMQGSLL